MFASGSVKSGSSGQQNWGAVPRSGEKGCHGNRGREGFFRKNAGRVPYVSLVRTSQEQLPPDNTRRGAPGYGDCLRKAGNTTGELIVAQNAGIFALLHREAVVRVAILVPEGL